MTESEDAAAGKGVKRQNLAFQQAEIAQFLGKYTHMTT